MPLSGFVTRRAARAFTIVFAFTLLAVTGLQGRVASAAPSIGNPSSDPCYTTMLLTVRQTSRIYYAPDTRAATSYLLTPGKRFFVCTNSKLNGWVAFRLTNRLPTLYVPTGIFG